MTPTTKVFPYLALYKTSWRLSQCVSATTQNCFSRMISSSKAEPTGKRNTTDAASGKKGEANSTSTTSSRGQTKKASNRPPNPQEFVKIRFEPGQWDTAKTDPLYLPPWKSKARIISEEDFVNRPSVGFSEEFASLADARVTFSHMTHETKDKLYQDYLDLMEAMNQREKVTSHEYVVNVIARKYNIMPDRAAAIIQLAHNEERIKVEFPDREIHYEFAKTMDAKILRFIQEVYGEYNELPPSEFVEETWEYSGKGSSQNVHVDDLYDLDELSKQAIVKERELAQKLIDTKVYKEDYDSSQAEVKVNQECQNLIKSHDAMKNLTSIYQNAVTGSVANPPFGSKMDKDDTTEPDEEKGERKPSRSFKFVAQTINTAEAKKKKKSSRKVKEQSSIIVEHNGNLRVPTEEELESTSWKSQRNLKEFMLQGAKKGWLDRNQKGIKTAWGKAPIDANKSAAVEKV